MEIALNSRPRKMSLLGTALLISATFLAASTLQFMAAHSATSAEHLNLAVRLAPGNAEYHELLGQELLQARTDIPGTLEQFRLATALNRHNAGYWLALAGVRQILNDTPGQRHALEHAIAADPTTPDVAWAAANFFLAQGDTLKALREFKIVIENEPGMAYATFGLCSHVADVQTISQDVLSSDPSAYLSFIEFLTSQKNTAGAVQVWNELARLGKPFESRRALAYINYLIAQHDVADARQAWRETSKLSGLSGYLPSRENLIVNPHFDFDILNSGFDWRYQQRANVEVALDPTEFHGGLRSLSIVFDGPGVSEAGIAQYVPVQPHTAYEFSVYYKANAMDGAGGPRVSIQDAFAGTDYFLSDDLRDADIWRKVSGIFTTGADAQLVIVRVIRVPVGSPIRGKLWLDDFHLAEKDIGS